MAYSSFATFYLLIKAQNAFSPVLAALRADFVRTSVALGAVAVPAAIGGGLLLATKAAASYEQQMRKVQALALSPAQQKQRQDLTDTTTAMGQLSAGVLALGSTVPYGPTKLAEALYMVSSAGYQGKDALSILRLAAEDAATGGLSDATSMARSLTSVLASYGAGAQQAGHYSDIFMTAVTRGKVQVDELDKALSTVLPTAAGAGIGFAQISAALATMTQHGTSASSAATSLRRVILALTAPTQAQRKTAETLGVGNLLSGRAVASLGMPAVIERLTQAAGGGAEGVGRLKQLFGTAQGFQAAMTLSGKSAATFNHILAEMNGLAGNGARTHAAFATTVAGLNERMRVAGSAINAAAVAVGLKLLPAAMRLVPLVQNALVGAFRLLGGLVDAVAGAFGRNSQKMSEASKTVRALLAAGAGFAAYKALMLGIAAAQRAWAAAVALATLAQKALNVVLVVSKALWIGVTTGTYAAAAASAAATAALWVINAAQVAFNAVLTATAVVARLAWLAITGPVGAVILVLAAVSLALIGMYQHVKWFHDAVDAVARFLRDHFTQILLGIPFVNMIVGFKMAYDHITVFHDAVNGLANALKNALGGAFDFIFNKVLHLGDLFRLLLGALKGLPGFLQGAAKGVIDLLNKVADFGAGLAAGTAAPAVAAHVARAAARGHLSRAGAGGALAGRGGPSGAYLSGMTIPPDLAPYLFGVPTTGAQRTAASALTDPNVKKLAQMDRATLSAHLSTARDIFEADKRRRASQTTLNADIARIVALTVAQQEKRGVSVPVATALGAALATKLTSELSKAGTAGHVLGQAAMHARGLGQVVYARQSRVAPGAAGDFGSTTVSFLNGARNDTSAQIIRSLQRALEAAKDQIDTLKSQLAVAKQQLGEQRDATTALETLVGHAAATARAVTAPAPGARAALRRAGVY